MMTPLAEPIQRGSHDPKTVRTDKLQPFSDEGIPLTVVAQWLNDEEIGVLVRIGDESVIETVLWQSTDGLLDVLYAILWRHSLDHVRLMTQHEANPRTLDRLFFSSRIRQHHRRIGVVEQQ